MSFLCRNFLNSKAVKHFHRHYSVCICPPPPKDPIVTVLDTSYTVGAHLALLLKQNPLISELRVYDEQKDAFGLAEDLNHIDTKVRVIPFGPSSLKDAIKGAYVVISTGGCQKNIKHTPKQLLEQNLDNVRNVALFLSEFNPTAIYCVAKPPVEILIPLVSEEYKKAETYDPRKIIGLTTYSATVVNTILARHMKVDPATVLCPIIGGASLKTLVPVISQTRPTIQFNSTNYLALQKEIANCEDKMLLKGSTWCTSKAVGIARFINLLLKALKGDTRCVESAFVAQTGHIGPFLPYMSSVVKLGPEGVISTHMPKINEFEIIHLKTVLPQVLKNICLGQSYLNGDFSPDIRIKRRRKPDENLKRKIQELSSVRGEVCGDD